MLALISRVSSLAKVGPFILRLGKQAPSTLAAAAARMRNAGHAVGNTAQSMLEWAKRNPTGAGLLVATIASLGVDVAELLEDGPGKEEAKAEARKLAQGDAPLNLNENSLALAAAARSETIAVNLGQGQSDAVADVREILSFASKFFGNAQMAKRAHVMLQGFFEMKYSDVVFGYDNLKT